MKVLQIIGYGLIFMVWAILLSPTESPKIQPGDIWVHYYHCDKDFNKFKIVPVKVIATFKDRVMYVEQDGMDTMFTTKHLFFYNSKLICR